MSVKLTPSQYEQLFGALNASVDILDRIHDDLFVPLVTLINLYGGIWRPPIRVLSWPVELSAEWQRLSQRVVAARKAALEAQDAGKKQDFEDGLRRLLTALYAFAETLHKDTRKLKHYHLSGYAKWLLSKLRVYTHVSTDLGNEKELEKLLASCREARRRFGDTLLKHGVQFDPPCVDRQFEYQPEVTTYESGNGTA